MKKIIAFATLALGCLNTAVALANDELAFEYDDTGEVPMFTNDYPGYPGYPGGYPGYPGYPGFPQFPWPCPPSDPSWPYPQPPGYCEPPRPNCGDFYRLEDRVGNGVPSCYRYQGRWSELDRRCYQGQPTWAERRFCYP